MACATLKRSLEFDPVYNSTSPRPSKRRRCGLIASSSMSPRTPPTKSHQVNQSPFLDVSPKWCSEIISTRLYDEVRRMHRRRQLHYKAGESSKTAKLAGQSSGQSSPPRSGNSSPNHSDCEMGPSSPPGSPTAGQSAGHPTNPASHSAQPLFTLKQVSLLCERMMKEREEKIKEEYDKILNCKLSEQYDAFVKFTYDQIQRRFNEAPISYVS